MAAVAGMLCFQLSCIKAASHGADFRKHEDTGVMAARKLISQGESQLRDGDLILRTGKDFISLSLRQFSVHDKTYSHCGLVRIEEGRPYVYHAIGGEDNPDGRLRRDRFETFCNPQYNSGFGIFRYRLEAAQISRLDSLINLFYKKRVRFDLKFDLSTDSSFYCAEFVYKAVERATGNPHFFSLSHIGNFEYVAIDNLFLTPYARAVYQTVFP